jgi:ubiquitin-protein ligase
MPSIRTLRDGLLEQEALLLQKAGYRVLSQELQDGTLWVLNVLAPDEKTGAGPLQLSITLPSSYPLLPPRVSTTDLEMAHHQHPFANDLCLLERSTENWIPEWHIAGLLDNQLKRAVAAGHAVPAQGQDEFQQGEPFSAYYTYADSAGFLIDSERARLPIGASGDLEASYTQTVGRAQRLLIIVDRMLNGREVAYEAPLGLHAAFAPHPPAKLTGRWSVLKEPPATNDPREIWEIARTVDFQGTRPNFQGSNGATHTIEVRAVAFPEEHGWKVTGTGWILVVKEHGGFHKPKKGSRKASASHKTPDTYKLVRAYRAGPSDLTYRAPESHGLEDKSVAVLGCGAIGSVLVEQLCRAGVGEFHLLDEDTLEPGNLSRHAGALDTVCIDKSAALAHRISQINPYANANPMKFHIGQPALIERQSETEVLTRLFSSVDLVIDATVEVGVQQYTSLISRDVRTTWLALEGSPGVGGGSVVKIDADSDACFACFQWHQYEGSIPEPMAVDSALVQPAGCAAPTFTGTGFDLSLIALQAARVAVGALLSSSPAGYPEDGHDAHILSLREKDGRPIPPAWRGFAVTRHPKCSSHEV